MLKWNKLGHVFSPNGEADWMHSYAQMPRPILINDRIRIYFATRPLHNIGGGMVSRIGWVDVESSCPTKVIAVSEVPAYDLGVRDSFDEFGVMPGDISIHGNKVQLLYTGWSRPKNYPYETSIGRVFCNIGDKIFERSSSSLLLGQTKSEPYLCNGPMLIELGGIQHLFYASGVKWISSSNRQESVYKIMHATSFDGENWIRNAAPCILDALPNECQNAPSIIFYHGLYYMIFCYRYAEDFRNKDRGYRLGYATSKDLISWERSHTTLFDGAPDESWENQMKCYPGILRVKDKIYMFYCGNNFGQTGFGVAELND